MDSSKRLGVVVSFFGLFINIEACRPSSHTTVGAPAAASLDQDFVAPNKAAYDQAFAMALLDANRSSLTSGNAISGTTVWLNFNGANVQNGSGPGQSTVICSNQATIPPSNLSTTDQATVVAMVTKFYSDVNTYPTFVTSQPSSGNYKTVHIGGTFSDIGCSGTAIGLAPLDSGNLNPNDIAFVMTANYDAPTTGITVAHELGHTFGLEHVSNQTDVMYPVALPTVTDFQVSPMSDGGGSQNEPSILQSEIGTGTGGTYSAAPLGSNSVASSSGILNSTTAPTNASYPGTSQLANLASMINSSGALSALTGSSNTSGLLSGLQGLAPSGAQSLNFPGLSQIVTFIAGLAQAFGGSASSGNLLGDLSTLGTALASGSMGSVMGDLGSLFTDLTRSAGASRLAAPPVAASTNLPDFAGLLGLRTNKFTAPTLITSFRGAAANLVASQKGSTNSDALMSLLEAAYLQEYQSLNTVGGVASSAH